LEATWHRGDWWGSEQTVRALFVAAYRHGLRAVGAVSGDVRLAGRLAEAIYDSYQDTRHWGLYADVLPTLAALHRAGLRMGIISDWGHGLEAIVLELELHGYLEFLVVSSRLGVSKPDPRVFQMALDRIGVAAEHAVYVGDTYIKDVLGARAAGLTPILLDRSGQAPAPDCLVVTTLAQLPALLGVPTTV
jgi:HAD superfamily hydrolase (TIGR01549 family)